MNAAASVKLDTSTPHPARVYDWLLGGKDNFAPDREFGEKMLAAYPRARQDALDNRAFMRRVATWLARDAGIRQFLDLGSGLPTSPNLHEVVQAVDPQSRIVYVDNDPLVMTHARALLVSDPAGVVEYTEADVRDPDAILAQAGQVLDLSQPVGLTMLAMLHYVPDADDPYGVVARLVDTLAPGSYLALSHGTHDLLGPASRLQMERLWAASPRPSQVRSRDQVARFFTGLVLSDPGIVALPQWRAGTDEAPDISEVVFYAAVARKP